MADYRMIFDLHTHTTFKKGNRQEVLHAVGSVEENVLAAREKGLSAVGISNHGPGHLTYGLPMECLAPVRREVEEARERYPDIKIYFGVEANIIDADGKLDIPAEKFSQFEYVMAGYHYGIFGSSPGRAALLHGSNWIYENLSFTRKLFLSTHMGEDNEPLEDRLLRVNTDMMVAAVKLSRPKILTHPGDKGLFDIAEIANACAATGTWMEINDSHRDLTVEGIREAMKYDVGFVIGSDAHEPEKVGCFEAALERAFQAGLPPERIVNIEKVQKSAGKPQGKPSELQSEMPEQQPKMPEPQPEVPEPPEALITLNKTANKWKESHFNQFTGAVPKLDLRTGPLSEQTKEIVPEECPGKTSGGGRAYPIRAEYRQRNIGELYRTRRNKKTGKLQ